MSIWCLEAAQPQLKLDGKLVPSFESLYVRADPRIDKVLDEQTWLDDARAEVVVRSNGAGSGFLRGKEETAPGTSVRLPSSGQRRRMPSRRSMRRSGTGCNP